MLSTSTARERPVYGSATIQTEHAAIKTERMWSLGGDRRIQNQALFGRTMVVNKDSKGRTNIAVQELGRSTYGLAAPIEGSK